MELIQVKYVLAIQKWNNLTNAANELSITPSSLSQQLKKLEEELGVELFSRTTRVVKPTEAGCDFIDYAQTIDTCVMQLKQKMNQYAVGEKGELEIGGTPALKAYGITFLLVNLTSIIRTSM